MKVAENQNREKRELIVETWIKLGHAPVTAGILRRIQRALARQFGINATDSPASIARALADEGAELRHPDVIEFDARWREARLKKSALNSAGRDATKPLTLKSAEAMLRRLESLRQPLLTKNEVDELSRLREVAINEKTRAQLLSRDDSVNESIRQIQSEIAEWFRVWLQTPEIFNDWLDLRQRSHEFQQTFSGVKSRREPSV